MKKQLLAIAVAGAFAAPAIALAQSNVTIYGTLDVSANAVKYSETNSMAAATGVSTLVAGQTKTDIYNGGATNIGFKGTEDLGNGLKAWFQIESNVQFDGRQFNNTAGFGGRNSAVGLQGGWGSVGFGNWDSPYKTALAGSMGAYGNGFGTQAGAIVGNGDTTGTQPNLGCDNAVQANGSITQTGNTTANTNAICTQVEGSATAFQRRLANSIFYVSPTFSGFTGRLAVETTGSQTDQSGTTALLGQRNNPQLYALSLAYAAGPLSLGVAYENHVGFRATTGAALPVAGATLNNMATDTGTLFTGAYDFKVVKVSAAMEQLKYGDTNPMTATGTSGGSTNFKQNAWFLGVSAPFGASEVYGGYSRTGGKKDCGTLGVSIGAAATQTGAFYCGSDSAASLVNLGYKYTMSKRTYVYTQYSKLTNAAGANFTSATPKAGVSGTNGSIVTGTDATVLSVGMRHTF